MACSSIVVPVRTHTRFGVLVLQNVPRLLAIASVAYVRTHHRRSTPSPHVQIAQKSGSAVPTSADVLSAAQVRVKLKCGGSDWVFVFAHRTFAHPPARRRSHSPGRLSNEASNRAASNCSTSTARPHTNARPGFYFNFTVNLRAALSHENGGVETRTPPRSSQAPICAGTSSRYAQNHTPRLCEDPSGTSRRSHSRRLSVSRKILHCPSPCLRP
ncbi:hypothetical protein C8Q80DRAFT_1135020 [Daedaleopsis nitida]|nr:hypothetical protein C8Q80DRAFT_1135020 [Daedaleopsis nitida]